jgi:uncharacterized protein YegP (UPF0339 family)
MFHLFQHTSNKLKGKYDFAFISKGKYICGSNQGYENKEDAIKSVHSVATHKGGVYCWVQDDTEVKSVIMCAVKNVPKRNLIITPTTLKTAKKYIPQ